LIELHVEPRVTKSWEEFQRDHPPFSIALDGYVSGRPAFTRDGPYANFDHHIGVDRLATRSTCMQVAIACRMGLFEVFRKNAVPHAHIYVNDPDQDTCLAIWLVRHPDALDTLEVAEPLANLLVTEDVLDCTGGAYPVNPDRLAIREQAWVFEPYIRARYGGRLSTMAIPEMRALINEVCGRITLHAEGRGSQLELDVGYDELGGGDGWRMIIERGPYARLQLMRSLVRAFVAVRENSDGTWTYSIGKMSPFVPFPIEALYAALNREEGVAEGGAGWGGSNTIGGSPRKGGSKLTPADVERVINEHLAD
jgi:hypothetical protein